MSHLQDPVTATDHHLGPLGAPVVLVEYGDYQCPYCGQAYPVVKRLSEQFGDRLCVVFRNFPLTNAHPQAENAAVVAEFAAAHGRFWEAHDALYENQRALGPELYVQLVQSLDLPVDALQKALDEGTYTHRIRHDMASAMRSGVNGTPGFFINGTRYDPRGGFDDLVTPIAALLETGGHAQG